VYHAGTQGHVFICLHGAGHSAMSFAALARSLKTQYTIVSFDFRGHGEHFTENETDLSEETLVNDAIAVVRYICQQYSDRSVILVGHSMGGSIATKATAKILLDYPHEEFTK
jgi:protein phosphatase methylesterase 1